MRYFSSGRSCEFDNLFYYNTNRDEVITKKIVLLIAVNACGIINIMNSFNVTTTTTILL